MIAVCISTYQRPDGGTPFYLHRALKSIKDQSYKFYKVFVTGDCYDNQDELRDICESYPKVEWLNLPESIERKKYPFGDYRLWCCGGVNAGITGINRALSQGFEYICQLDHDDWWEPNHLKLISGVIRKKHPLFICTVSTYFNSYLPLIEEDNKIEYYSPRPGGCMLSASCIKYSEIDIRFRDVFEITGSPYPADADMWERLREFMINNNKKGYLIQKITCHHDEEGYTFRGDFK